MNPRFSLVTQHVEVTLTPNADEMAVQITLDPPGAEALERPMTMILLTLEGARSFAQALRTVVEELPDEGDGCVVPVTDRCCKLTVEPYPISTSVLVTLATHPPHVCGWRGIVMNFGLSDQDASRLAELLDQTSLLAYPVGGVA